MEQKHTIGLLRERLDLIVLQLTLRLAHDDAGDYRRQLGGLSAK